MEPTTKITLYWTNKLKQKEHLQITYDHFKTYVIELLEDEMKGKLSEVYYFVEGSSATIKLDYYNTEEQIKYYMNFMRSI